MCEREPHIEAIYHMLICGIEANSLLGNNERSAEPKYSFPSELQGYWTLSIVRISNNYKTQHLRNWNRLWLLSLCQTFPCIMVTSIYIYIYIYICVYF
jgi:hypothetical protein